MSGAKRLTANESTTLAVDVACGVSPSGGTRKSSHLTIFSAHPPSSPNLVPALSSPRYPSNTLAP